MYIFDFAPSHIGGNGGLEGPPGPKSLLGWLGVHHFNSWTLWLGEGSERGRYMSLMNVQA